ncbi:MAG: magnesium transporter [Candidatus Cloacimonetes bacterium]|nr:magnesium transporter [Candidatus Cloacimonadota bacterium]
MKSIIDKINVVDIADLFELLEKDQLIKVFRLCGKEKAADLFSYLSHEHQQYIIESISDREIKNIIDELFIDDTVDFIEEMPANVVNKVLKNTDDETRKTINLFLTYPDNSAGSLMTIEFVGLKKDMTVAQAIDNIKKNGVDKETINNCYVIDEQRKLVGIVSIRRLILSDNEVLIKDIMETHLIKASTIQDQEEIATLFKKYDYTSIPVVDRENCLVGIITIDDIVDIIEQENTEDFQIMAAVTPTVEEYLKTSVIQHTKNRIVWLFILMVSATISGAIINKYDRVLQNFVLLASFIPMLMDTGGNCGSQSSTLIIRGIALAEIKFKHTLIVIWKELRISMIVGAILGVLNYIRIVIFNPSAGLKVPLVVSISLCGTVIISKLIGSTLPILAQKIKIDPALMAAPLITTLADGLALILYFTLATFILNIS